MSFFNKDKIIEIIIGLVGISLLVILSIRSYEYYRIFFSIMFFLTFIDISFHYITFGFVFFCLCIYGIFLTGHLHPVQSLLGAWCMYDWLLLYFLRNAINYSKLKSILSIYSIITMGKTLSFIIFIYIYYCENEKIYINLLGNLDINCIGKILAIKQKRYTTLQEFLTINLELLRMFAIWIFLYPALFSWLPSIILCILYKTVQYHPTILYAKSEDTYQDYILPFTGVSIILLTFLFSQSLFFILISIILGTGFCSYFFWLGWAYLDVIRHNYMLLSTILFFIVTDLSIHLFFGRQFCKSTNWFRAFTLDYFAIVILIMILGIFESIFRFRKNSIWSNF